MLLTNQKQANVPQAPFKSKLQAFVQPRAWSSFIKYIWTNLGLLSPQIFLVYLMWYIPSQQLSSFFYQQQSWAGSQVDCHFKLRFTVKVLWQPLVGQIKQNAATLWVLWILHALWLGYGNLFILVSIALGKQWLSKCVQHFSFKYIQLIQEEKQPVCMYGYIHYILQLQAKHKWLDINCQTACLSLYM